MDKKTIYIFRHGQTDYNVSRRVMGQLDIPLNETGLTQATKLAEKMLDKQIKVIYTSPLSRAKQTAQIVSKKIGASLISDNKLKERNNGKLEGHIVHGTDNPAEYQTDYNQLELFLPVAQLNDNNWKPDEGESRTECWERAKKAITTIVKNTPYDTIAISTHSVIMRGILNMVGMNDEKIGNCEYVKLGWDGKSFIR